MSQSGSKVILFRGDALISILRDDTPSIKFPNHWDLPGGGIEQGETPFEALRREVDEELGLQVLEENIVWRKTYRNAAGLSSYFFAIPVTDEEIGVISFGEEGQCWQLMPIRQYCRRTDTVPHFRSRVAEFLEQY